jgi:hypothetical protein
MPAFFTLLKNIGNNIHLGSPSSALTQIGDVSFSLYKNGMVNTIASVGMSARDAFVFTYRKSRNFKGVSLYEL